MSVRQLNALIDFMEEAARERQEEETLRRLRNEFGGGLARRW